VAKHLKSKDLESVSNPYYPQVQILIMHNMNAFKTALQGQDHECKLSTCYNCSHVQS